MFDLTGKNALVTGASGGIGGAIAKGLHARGATVGLSGTRVEPLEALATELGERIASAVVYLASQEAGYITGTTLHVNGGMAMY